MEINKIDLKSLRLAKDEIRILLNKAESENGYSSYLTEEDLAYYNGVEAGLQLAIDKINDIIFTYQIQNS